MIDEKIHKLSEMDNDTLHWINDKLKEFIDESGRNLRKIAVQQIYCINWIVSQDFGGNKYSKNSMIMYIVNDKF